MAARRNPRGAWVSLGAAAIEYEGHISRWTLWRMACEGVIRGRRVGRCWDLLRADLHRLMNDPDFAARRRAAVSRHRPRKRRSA